MGAVHARGAGLEQMRAEHPPALLIAGPTASGKSALALALAQRLGGVVINADSMQLYAGMDIGTAKLAPDERGGVPHHLLDVWPLAKSAAVAEYQAMARAAIREIHGRGRVPLLVGGSGLYLRGALDRLEFPGESPDVRAALYAERRGQIDLSCAQCHDDHAGRRLAGSTIPQAHPTGYPLYRLEWQGLGSLQRRLRGCMTGVRSEPYPYGAPEYVEIELFLMGRAAGMAMETPAVRP